MIILRIKDILENVSKTSFVFNWNTWQIIGRSFGKEGPLQPLMKLEQELANRLANPGTDGMLNAIPFLRFLPLPMSSIYHKAKSVHQQLLDRLEMLSVLCLCLNSHLLPNCNKCIMT